MLKVYGIKNCDSVKKAIKFFKEHNLAYELHDFKQESVGCEHINRWLQHVEVSKLFNTRGMTYRTLKLKELNLSDDDKTTWLCKENMLIKRPVIEHNNTTVVGFDLTKYEGEFLL
jgi:Spx/MgsR family transcriptional regulator